MVAHLQDLVNWTSDPEQLYIARGNPSGLDNQYAHKTLIAWNPQNITMYLFYCAVGDKGWVIGLITSKLI